MRCDLLPISELSKSDLAAWEELGSAAVVPNPFVESAFALPATRAWGVDDLGLLVVRDRSDWLAALPVRQVRSWRGVPSRCLVGWRHSYCYLGMPLVADGDTAAILASLLSGGVQACGCLALDWIDVDGPLREPLTAALGSGLRWILVDQFERAALYRRPGDGPEPTLSSRTRSGYRRKLRLLERELGELTVRDRCDDPSAYRRFLELERAGWRGDWGTAMGGIPGHGEFFIDMCERFSRAGRLQLLALESEQHTVAMKSNLIAGDALFFFKPVFDETFGRYSPGVQLELASMESFRAGEWTMFDSCTAPDNAMYNRLWSERRRLRSVVVTSRGASGALPYATWRAAAAALPIRRKLQERRAATGQDADSAHG